MRHKTQDTRHKTQDTRHKTQDTRHKTQDNYNSRLNFVKGGSPAKLLICVPTYNESENIAPFIHAVFEHSPPDAHILVVDDSSPDGTADMVEGIIPVYPYRLHILKRPGKQGGASAFLQSFTWGIDQGYEAMLAMDADFSHEPRYIQEIISLAKEYDVVIGSRLAQGGGIENRSFIRNIISRGASLYCRILLNVPIKDWTGGYNLWTKKALAAIDIPSVFTRGYSFQIEMKYKAACAQCRIAEVPIIFPDRRGGVSKMSGSYFIKALLDVWRIKYVCLPNGLKQFIKFAITGGLGTITNLLIFFMLADKAGLPEIPVSAGCFAIAGTQNYIVNHKWSFIAATGTSPLSIKKWLLFLGASCAGLFLNLTVMKLILINFTVPYKFIAQACGIAAGMIINFICSKFIVFKKRKHHAE